MGNSRSVMKQLLIRTVELEASDLHLTADSTPRVRIAGKLIPTDHRVLKRDECRELIYSVMNDSQRDHFKKELEVDFGFELEGTARFRANVFTQQGCVAAVLRVIPMQIRSLENLRLPPVLAEFTAKRRGLILITGPTGSGKSTTLAAMIDRINHNRAGHIITIEDPIEFRHSHRSCLVNQRELSEDIRSFSQALRTILREDPDVVLLGELRDLDTVTSALRIAETGHLTLATLHTNTAQSTINRVISMFPPHQQDQVRRQLALVLEGIVCQNLLPRADGNGRVVATEILIPTLGIRNLIRDKKDHQIYSLMQTGQDRLGMRTMNQSLVNLLDKKEITYEVAVRETPDISELRELFQLRGIARESCFTGREQRLNTLFEVAPVNHVDGN